MDSDPLIRQDPRLRALNLTNIGQILTHHYWWPSRDTNLYRPLTTFTYLLNHTVFGSGENPAGYHLVNLLLHWTNAWLVLLIVRRLAGRLDVAGLTAAIFAVHPVTTESVTNIVGRADLLATLCVLLAGWCYLRSLDSGVSKRRWLSAMGVIACAGVLAKENGVMIVGFVGLYDFLWRWPGLEARRWPQRLKTASMRFWPEYAALVPAVLLFGLIRRWMSHTTLMPEEVFVDNPIVGARPFQGFMTAIHVVGRYLKLLVFPRTLSADYSFNQIPLYGTGNSGSDTIALVLLAVLTLLIGAAFLLRQRHRLLSWGLLFLFGMMLPTSNLLLTIGSIMAERFLYLPSIGFCTVAAAGLSRLSGVFVSFEPLKPRAAIVRWVLLAFVIGGLGVRTFVRNADWHDQLSLWNSTVAASPQSFRARLGLGGAIWQDALQNKTKPQEPAIDEAIAQAEIARSILEPLPLKWQNNNTYLDLGNDYAAKADLLDRSGHPGDAMRYFKKSIEVLEKARELDRVVNQRSREFRLRQGVPADEIFDVGNYLIYKSLGLNYCRVSEWQNCEMTGRYLQRLAPDESSGYLLVGGACFNLGRYAEAAVQYIAGLLLDPRDDVLWTSLSVTYDTLGVEPNPVTKEGAHAALNSEIPRVRQQINEAAITVVRLFKDAKRFEAARTSQEQFIKQYSVPPETFSRADNVRSR